MKLTNATGQTQISWATVDMLSQNNDSLHKVNNSLCQGEDSFHNTDSTIQCRITNLGSVSVLVRVLAVVVVADMEVPLPEVRV